MLDVITVRVRSMGLEGAVDPLSLLLPADKPLELWLDRNNWVCAIEDGAGKIGTGILVGADLVLTNYHVMETLYGRPENFGLARCRFNHREDSALGDFEERPVKLAANWSQDLPKSRYSDKDESGDETGFEPDCLDYAIIRLAEKVGDQGVDDPANPDAPQRGWLTIPDALGLPQPNAPIWILQHPAGPDNKTALPLKRSDGKVLKLLDVDMRLRHDATTFGGSSGGACFDSAFNFVALHQAGQKAATGQLAQWNQAIPVTAIVRHMRVSNFGHLIGVAPPPRRKAVRRLTAEVRGIAVAEGVVGHRLRAAKMLMDRDDPENLVNWYRGQENPGILHLIACRHIDSHQNFLERLTHLSLDNLGADARRKREAALLGAAGAAGEQPWMKASVRWPKKNYPASVALGMLMTDLNEHLKEHQKSRKRMILEAATPIEDCDPARDRGLMLTLAKTLVDMKIKADRMQIFIVYSDKTERGKPDQYKARRESLCATWSLEERPPGCGVCMALDDVDSFDLGSWCDAMQTALKVDQDAIRNGVDAALPEGMRVPMLQAEEALVPIVRPYIEKIGQ
jgi:hypothetical protein